MSGEIRFCELPELHSQRLVLRRVRREDAKSYFRNLGSREEVARGMLWNPHQDPAESEESIEKTLRRYDEGRCYRWAVTEQGSDELIGIVELLRFDETERSCSFAYMLTPGCWGRGYGTEVLKTVFRFAFCRMGVEVIRADHFADNPASGAAMRKAGMKRIAAVSGKYVKNGVARDAVAYEIRK